MTVTKNFDKIALAEGAFYINKDETGEQLVGYAKGGTYTDNLVIRHIEVDGKKGNVKGDAVVEEIKPQLDFTAMQMESDVIGKLFAALTLVDNTDGTFKVTRKLTITEADYLTNVAWVGVAKDGTELSIKLLNALGEAPMNFTITDKGEIEIPCTFTGNYATVADTVAPVEIQVADSAE